MAIQATLLNTMLDAMPSTLYVEATDGDPTGAHSVISVARESHTFGAASGTQRDATNQPVMDINAGSSLTHLAWYDASTAGTLQAVADVTDESWVNAGTYTVDSTTISAS